MDALTPQIKHKMINAGFTLHETFTSDHVPIGENPDPIQWAKYVFSQRRGERRANIHMRIDGSLNQQYALLFRDYLRTHPAAAQTIERIKRELAKRHAMDADAYYAIKDPIYDLVWQAAKAWARHWA